MKPDAPGTMFIITAILLVLLVVGPAMATDGCADTCRDGVLYTNGVYDRERGTCSFTTQRCEYGCSTDGTACSGRTVTTTVTRTIVPVTTGTTDTPAPDVRRACPDYCTNGISYAGGVYDSSAGPCRYVRTACEYGCSSDGTTCGPAPASTAVCGNGACERGEDSRSCYRDCHCGDGACDSALESGTCPADCPETAATIAAACPSGCSCMTRQAGVDRFGSAARMCSGEPCGTESDGTPRYCIGTSGVVSGVQANCTDPDGSDIYTQGTSTGLDSYGTSIISVTDFCSNASSGPELPGGKWVVEEQCDPDGKIHGYYYECPTGYWCSFGECVYRPGMLNLTPAAAASVSAEVRGDRIILTRGGETREMENRIEEARRRYATGSATVVSEAVEVQDDRPVYSLRIARRGMLLGFIPVTMEAVSSVDAETLVLVKEEKPWWGFLVSESNPQPSP